MITKFLRRWFPGTSKSSRSSAASTRGYKPCAEVLEDRVVPTWTIKDLTTTTAAAMVQNLLTGGTDKVSNVTYTGAAIAAGTFTDTQSVVGFGTGIVMSSGSAKGVAGPNNLPSSIGLSTVNGAASDPQLNALIAPTPGVQASVLQFDYKPTGAFVSFTYVFGSEEYPDFAPPVSFGFADVFGFFVNGKNYALIPGTVTPVSINTVNAVTNTQYYVNNFTNPGGPIYGPHNTQMNAYTTVLMATLPVVPGISNHIKLAIEDASDTINDSWVLIQTGSLRSFNIPAYDPLRFDLTPSTGVLTGSFTVSNPFNFSYTGPVYLIFPSLPSGVTVLNATGVTVSGHPYILVGNGLTPYSSLHVTVKLTNPFKLSLGTYFNHLPTVITPILY